VNPGGVVGHDIRGGEWAFAYFSAGIANQAGPPANERDWTMPMSLKANE
jgi:hypothetical protein